MEDGIRVTAKDVLLLAIITATTAAIIWAAASLVLAMDDDTRIIVALVVAAVSLLSHLMVAVAILIRFWRENHPRDKARKEKSRGWISAICESVELLWCLWLRI